MAWPCSVNTVQLNRSPVTNNTASGPIGGLGGGIDISDGSLTLIRSPVNANTASSDGGGIYLSPGGPIMVTVSLQDSPVRRNQPNNCVNVPGC